MSNKLTEVAISIPFSVNNYGSIAIATSQQKIWADRVKSVIGTAVGERVMRPAFGTKIPRALFETVEAMQEIIDIEVSTAFAELLPSLSLVGVTTAFDVKSNVLTAEITYSLPNNQVESTSVGIAAVTEDTPFLEVI